MVPINLMLGVMIDSLHAVVSVVKFVKEQLNINGNGASAFHRVTNHVG